MILWWLVFVNGLWVLGLAVLLAGFGYHYWLAQENKVLLREQLGSAGFGLAAWAGLGLVGAGLAGSSGQWWESVVWIAFTVYCVVKVGRFWKSRL